MNVLLILYHLFQALYRKIRSLALTDYIETTLTAAMVLGMCYVLPLLPAERIVEAMNAIEYVASMNALVDLEPFLAYVRGK